jgi:hypothetical protein
VFLRCAMARAISPDHQELPRRVLQGILSAGRWHVIFNRQPGVAELADAPDSKSGGRKAVWVRPPPPGP